MTLGERAPVRHSLRGCQRLTAEPLVVDLFAGMGGLSLGFKKFGFRVRGFDAERHAVASYAANVGPARLMNLREELPDEQPAVLVGGPPCRPWSPINLQRRRTSHDDYDLVDRFRQAVLVMQPCAFVLENVPFLRKDAQYQSLVESLSDRYDVTEDVYSYGDWGAATRRRRLFAIGIEKGHVHGQPTVQEGLTRRRVPPQSVAQATHGLSLDRADPDLDHDWPQFRTIEKYAHKYATGKYGWYRLDEDQPAPSFGNVMKTYTLRKGRGGSADRAVSPREAIAILGFPSSYRFPAGVPRTAKYRMAADAVSPVFGEVVAEVIAEALGRTAGDGVD